MVIDNKIIILAIIGAILSYPLIKISSIADNATAHTYNKAEMGYLEEKSSVRLALLKQFLIGKSYGEVKIMTNKLDKEFDILEAPNQIFIGSLCIEFKNGAVSNIE